MDNFQMRCSGCLANSTGEKSSVALWPSRHGKCTDRAGKGHWWPKVKESATLSQDIMKRKQILYPKSTRIWVLHTSTSKIYLTERNTNFETELPIGWIEVLCESNFHHCQNNHKPRTGCSYSICAVIIRKDNFNSLINSSSMKYIQKRLKNLNTFSLW